MSLRELRDLLGGESPAVLRRIERHRADLFTVDLECVGDYEVVAAKPTAGWFEHGHGFNPSRRGNPGPRRPNPYKKPIGDDP